MNLFIPADQLKNRLTQENLVTPERFDALATEAERKNQNLIDVLISERVATADYLSALVAAAFGVELANLAARTINEETLRLLPEDLSRQREVIAFAREEDGTIDVAMADPSNLETIEFLTQRLGAKVKPFLAVSDDLDRGFAIYGSRSTGDFKKIVEENIQASLRSPSRTSEEAATEVPIVSIVDSIMAYAISMRASDIHIEVIEEATMIRYRIDGILYEIIRIPKTVHSALVARLKILSGLKIDEHYKPQDGRFRHQMVNQVVDVRVAVMPTYYGEKVEMRLLESSQKPLSLEELGMLKETAAIVVEAIKKTFGIVLVCGPTGSGKTTTLYGLMEILNKPNVNVCSIEDPIEYNMRYVNQSQINVQAGVTFATGLRALLRQDPNIIMVGEIRDKETAGIAVQAALTGHLLLSSLHTNDAPTAVPRLFDLGVPPFLAASTLNLIIAQRLVRRICAACIYSYDAGEDIKKAIEKQLVELGVPNGAQAVPKTFYRGKGCVVCGDTGYRGRLAIVEVLKITDTMKNIIVDPQFSLQAITGEARNQGSRTMFEDGLEKIQLGITTIEEVMRVIKE
ncbi:MAG: GspE/PulE family protein [Patescibacteria group bacterium]|mgnify:FL=1